jgi:hypothetical protein
MPCQAWTNALREMADTPRDISFQRPSSVERISITRRGACKPAGICTASNRVSRPAKYPNNTRKLPEGLPPGNLDLLGHIHLSLALFLTTPRRLSAEPDVVLLMIVFALVIWRRKRSAHSAPTFLFAHRDQVPAILGMSRKRPKSGSAVSFQDWCVRSSPYQG